MAESTETAAGETPRNFELLLDIPLEVTVEIGRTRLAIRELLQPRPGSAVELQKLAGETLDVLITGKAIPRGEAVTVYGKLGVPRTDPMTPPERLPGRRCSPQCSSPLQRSG